jgi:hypothetical protein
MPQEKPIGFFRDGESGKPRPITPKKGKQAGAPVVKDSVSKMSEISCPHCGCRQTNSGWDTSRCSIHGGK